MRRLRGVSVSYDAASGVVPQPPDFERFDFDTPIVGPIYGYNAPESVSGGIYQMGPTQQDKYTFWATNPGVLDHSAGVEVAARLKLVSQSSVNMTDRAGLALSFTDDRNLYNELYINENEIFINKRVGDSRVRDVAFAMDTTSAFHDYLMSLQGDVLTVLVDGVPRLSGSMFDANGLNLPTSSNIAVVGDITQSAASTWQMQTWTVSVVPEPAASLIIVCGILVPWARRPRRGN